MGFPGSSGSCLGLVAFFMAGGVSGGVSGTIGVGGGGGEGSPSGEGLGSWGILANTAERSVQERREGQSLHMYCQFTQQSALSSGLIQIFYPCARPNIFQILMAYDERRVRIPASRELSLQ